MALGSVADGRMRIFRDLCVDAGSRISIIRPSSALRRFSVKAGVVLEVEARRVFCGLCSGVVPGRRLKRLTRCLTAASELFIISFLCCTRCGGSLKS